MCIFEVSSAGKEENGPNVSVLPAADVGWYIGNNGRVGTGHMHLCVYELERITTSHCRIVGWKQEVAP